MPFLVISFLSLQKLKINSCFEKLIVSKFRNKKNKYVYLITYNGKKNEESIFMYKKWRKIN